MPVVRKRYFVDLKNVMRRWFGVSSVFQLWIKYFDEKDSSSSKSILILIKKNKDIILSNTELKIGVFKYPE